MTVIARVGIKETVILVCPGTKGNLNCIRGNFYRCFLEKAAIFQSSQFGQRTRLIIEFQSNQYDCWGAATLKPLRDNSATLGVHI